ncbi:Probable formate transporter [Seminavis robusta]|uniref:Probable formate transporter n=1 Tax=Seminavis robusta TaxID=568900 RepID=A0A9N8DAL4_9STRA|nr:Probable formate transporter [Seminavis robusta]|eukprot:Sro62_g035260.1 Probable formate transporter (407) ;mRNA; f:21158-22378
MMQSSDDIEAQAESNQEVTHAMVEPTQTHTTMDDPDTAAAIHSMAKQRKSLKDRLLRKDSNASSHKPSTPTTTAPSIHIPPATKAPKETLKAVYAAGKYKAGLTWNVLAVQSFMAGVYIASAGHLYLAVGGGVLGAALFPFGLIAVILTSAELFTGDALIFVASVLGRQVPFSRLVRNWTVAWCSNFVGCLTWAYFLSYLSDALVDSHANELAIQVAEKKALNSMGSIFLKAIGANFMVCVAVWQGTCAEEVAGKVLALWFPTAAFVMMGFDHVVANMYLIPVGMMLGADVSFGRMVAALAMATLGNAIGGGIFVGGIYWYVFDSMASFGGLTARIRQNMRHVTRLQHQQGGSFVAGNSSFRTGGWGHHHHQQQQHHAENNSTKAAPPPPPPAKQPSSRFGSECDA